MLYGQISTESHGGLGQKIRMTLHLNPTRLKDSAVKGEIGRVRVIGGPNIPNVPGPKVEMRDMQRFGDILIHIGDIGIFDSKLIDLNGIK